MNTIDIIDTNAHYYNLGKIEGTMWKHKIAITTNLRRSHANAFGNHRLCGCFTKSIMRHQKNMIMSHLDLLRLNILILAIYNLFQFGHN